MNLEVLGNVGDFIGGVAVLLTLFYLAFQIRQNTSEVRNATVQRLMEQSTQIFSVELTSGSQSQAIALKHQAGEKLSDLEIVHFRMFTRRNLQLFEQVYMQYLQGRIDDEVMDAYINRINAHFRMPLWESSWETLRPTYTKGFAEYVDALKLNPPPGLVITNTIGLEPADRE